MTTQRQIPASLSVIAYLFLLMGVMSAVKLIAGVVHGSFSVDIGVLGFWIFFGLRRGVPGWRICALVFIWFWMIGLAVAFVYGFVGKGPVSADLFGRHYGDLPTFWVSVVAAVIFPLEYWMYRVLTRPDIRSLFYEGPQTAPAAL